MVLVCDTYHGFIEDLQIGEIALEGEKAMLGMCDFMWVAKNGERIFKFFLDMLRKM